MACTLNDADITSCLDELEREFLRVGADRCNRLEKQCQLSAFLRLGLRSISLLRGMHVLLSQCILDSHDAVRRAFLESWELQFEFRKKCSSTRALKWLLGVDKSNSWKADRKKLADFVASLGASAPNFGREWGELTELAHPTAQATENSITIVLARHNAKDQAEQVKGELQKLRENFPGLLMREIWLVDATHHQLIDIHISRDNLKHCEKVFGAFLNSKGKE